jgi:opacity protein-like surface antigen
MRRMMRVFVFVAATAVALAPAEAGADWFLSPWVGANFANDDFADDVDAGQGTYGVTVGVMGGGIIGAEFDFGYSPTFFGDEDVFGSNNVMTMMGNLIVGIPFGGTTGGGVRPYFSGGLGLMRQSLDGIEGVFDDDDLSSNEFAFNVGGGVMGYFSQHFGIRGDIRYFRNFADSSDFDNPLDFDVDLGGLDFWRASIGIVIR